LRSNVGIRGIDRSHVGLRKRDAKKKCEVSAVGKREGEQKGHGGQGKEPRALVFRRIIVSSM